MLVAAGHQPAWRGANETLRWKLPEVKACALSHVFSYVANEELVLRIRVLLLQVFTITQHIYMVRHVVGTILSTGRTAAKKIPCPPEATSEQITG